MATSTRNVICEATFRAQSNLVSKNIKFKLFEQYFQNVQLFSIRCLNIHADRQAANFIKTALIFDLRCTVYQ